MKQATLRLPATCVMLAAILAAALARAETPPDQRPTVDAICRTLAEAAAADAKEFQTDVIEVVGHTDDPIQGIVSNLDTMSFDVLVRGEPAGRLSAADNAGLGLARAIAIAQIAEQRRATKQEVYHFAVFVGAGRWHHRQACRWFEQW